MNNARSGLVGAIEEIDEGAARAIVDTNTFGALWVTQAALPHLAPAGLPTPQAQDGSFQGTHWRRGEPERGIVQHGAPDGVGRPLARNPRLPEPRILTSVAFAHPVAAGYGMREYKEDVRYSVCPGQPS